MRTRRKPRDHELSRSEALYQSRGYYTARTEHKTAWGHSTDFLRCCDMVAWHPDRIGQVLVQATSASNVAGHMAKVLGHTQAGKIPKGKAATEALSNEERRRLTTYLDSTHGRFEIHGWDPEKAQPRVLVLVVGGGQLAFK